MSSDLDCSTPLDYLSVWGFVSFGLVMSHGLFISFECFPDFIFLSPLDCLSVGLTLLVLTVFHFWMAFQFWDCLPTLVVPTFGWFFSFGLFISADWTFTFGWYAKFGRFINLELFINIGLSVSFGLFINFWVFVTF